MKQHILVVDDEEPIRDLLHAYFRKHGYRVTSAEGGPEAVKAVAETPTHLVLLDVLLGDTDGLDVLMELKAAHPALPVIIMTGIGMDDQLIQEAVQKGASGYVSKTVPLEELLAKVQTLLPPK